MKHAPVFADERPVLPVEAWSSNGLRGKPLTRREVQVLALGAQGFTAKEVGASLGISMQTVKNHRTSINGKLAAASSAHAVALAIAAGVLPRSAAIHKHEFECRLCGAARLSEGT